MKEENVNLGFPASKFTSYPLYFYKDESKNFSQKKFTNVDVFRI